MRDAPDQIAQQVGSFRAEVVAGAVDVREARHHCGHAELFRHESDGGLHCSLRPGGPPTCPQRRAGARRVLADRGLGGLVVDECAAGVEERGDAVLGRGIEHLQVEDRVVGHHVAGVGLIVGESGDSRGEVKHHVLPRRARTRERRVTQITPATIDRRITEQVVPDRGSPRPCRDGEARTRIQKTLGHMYAEHAGGASNEDRLVAPERGSHAIDDPPAAGRWRRTSCLAPSSPVGPSSQAARVPPALAPRGHASTRHHEHDAE